MRIAGTGIDLVDVARIADVLERHGDRFLDRIFTPAEAAYCRSQGAPEQHLAGRFAVKEAVLKALGTGLIKGMRWRDVEVRTEPSGAPDVRLRGRVADRAEELRVARIHVSISHTERHAVAQAIAEAEEG